MKPHPMNESPKTTQLDLIAAINKCVVLIENRSNLSRFLYIGDHFLSLPGGCASVHVHHKTTSCGFLDNAV